MTVLVVGGSTAAALGIGGGIIPGLVSCAGSGSGPAMEAASEECEGPGSHAIAIVSLDLEAVGAIKRNAILAVIAQRQI